MSSTGGLVYLALLFAYVISRTIGKTLKEAIQRRRLERSKRRRSERRRVQAGEEAARVAAEEEQARVAAEEEQARIAEEALREMAPVEAVANEEPGRSFWFYSFLLVFFLVVPLSRQIEIIGDVSTIWGFETIMKIDMIGVMSDYDGFSGALLSWFVLGLWLTVPTQIWGAASDVDKHPIYIFLMLLGLICYAVFCYGALALWVHQLVNLSSDWVVAAALLLFFRIFLFILHRIPLPPTDEGRAQHKPPSDFIPALDEHRRKPTKRFYKEEEEHTPLTRTRCSSRSFSRFTSGGEVQTIRGHCNGPRGKETPYCGFHRCQGQTSAGKRCKSKKTDPHFCQVHQGQNIARSEQYRATTLLDYDSFDTEIEQTQRPTFEQTLEGLPMKRRAAPSQTKSVHSSSSSRPAPRTPASTATRTRASRAPRRRHLHLLPVARSTGNVLPCPQCDKLLRIPIERRPTVSRCPACRAEFIAQSPGREGPPQ